MKDGIAVFEAAYALEGDERTWLSRLGDAVRLNVEGCAGLRVQTYDATQADLIAMRVVEVCGWDTALAEAVESDVGIPLSVMSTDVRRALVRIFRTRFVGSLRAAVPVLRRVGLGEEHVRRYESALGHSLDKANHEDCWWINSQDPTGIGCLFGVWLRFGKRPHPREIHRWHCMASHVASAFRVRRQLAAFERKGPGMAGSAVEAILKPDGTLEHAESAAQSDEARERLRSACIALDRARGPLRRDDPNKAIEIWHALVAGRWSLLDQFESDGRRYVVAHRNDAKVPDARGLTLRERQVLAHLAVGHSNKMIGYELGLSTSTVSDHLASVRAKLGAPTTAALLREFTEAPPPATTVSDGRSAASLGPPAVNDPAAKAPRRPR
jgi:DNA-binding NarL/FixJ family response regulator